MCGNRNDKESMKLRKIVNKNLTHKTVFNLNT